MRAQLGMMLHWLRVQSVDRALIGETNYIYHYILIPPPKLGFKLIKYMK